MNAYHNTTNLQGAELDKCEQKAKSQDETVLELFSTFDKLGLTPERALRHLRIMEKPGENRWANTPVTSIRRSFSNLSRTKDKNGNPITPKIEKSDEMVMGDYGKLVHTWRLV